MRGSCDPAGASGTLAAGTVALEGGDLEVTESARGVQQGCSLGPLCYRAGVLEI